MSMRVFHAYLFKENAEFNDINEARKYVRNLADEYVKWVAKDMVKWETLLKLDRFEQMKKLESDTKDPEKGGVWDYQLQCTMFARELNGVNYIALQFFPSNPVAKFLKEHVKLREFWYENQTDEGFDLPDWELRTDFWNKVYDEAWSPSQAGFSCDIYDGTDFRTTHKIMAEFSKLTRAKETEKETEKE